MAAFDSCNDTELYQLCVKAGYKVTPTTSRDILEGCLMGEVDGDEEPHQIHPWRHGLTGFVFDHWTMLEPQISCPIKSKDPKSCWGCIDTRVVSCVEQSTYYINEISRHKKEE